MPKVPERDSGVMSSNDAIAVVRELNIEDVLSHYSVEMKHGKGHCPFHNDIKTPNLSIKYNRYFCFACGAKGDALDFVQRMFGLNFKDALAKINIDFSLGLDTSARYNPTYTIKDNNRKRREFDKWCNDLYIKLCEVYRRARRIMLDFDFDNPKCKAAADVMPQLECYLDVLAYGSLDERKELYKNRKEVTAVAGRI